MGPVNFAKKVRGKKVGGQDSSKIPEMLTMRICADKSAEVFDFSGIALPIVAGFKIDLHELHLSSYSWDDEISDSDREMWIQNFEVMNRLGTCVTWSRAVIPTDAVNMNMELIGAGDASEKIACSGCYIRFKRKNGSLSCQLLFAKSKIVNNMTLPRAELLAATLNTHATEIVKRSLKNHVTNTIYVLDYEEGSYIR